MVDHIKDNIRHAKKLITFANSEIACMVKVRDKFPENRAIQDYTRFFITIFTAEIEELTKEVESGREEIARIS